MLLTITTTYFPATDLGYLLHKNPSRLQTFELSYGKAQVFYPDASPERCTAALLLDIDPVGLVRDRKGSGGEGLLDQYVNDRPYVASSFLSVAIAQVYGSALGGRSKDRPELAGVPIPLTAGIPVIYSPGGEEMLRTLFEPLGYAVQVANLPLDERFPSWGNSRYFSLEVSQTITLKELLTHLYVLVPALDDEKHYWVGRDELEKLLRHGSGWLAMHPAKELIAERYLKRQRHLAREALARLVDDSVDPEETASRNEEQEAAIEGPIRLHDQRMGAVIAALKKSEAKRVIDLGCGEGRLLRLLLDDSAFAEVAGMDVSHRSLQIAAERMRLDQMAPLKRERLKMFQGSLIYRDKRLEGFDAATIIEVIEHLDLPRLAAFERVVFESARPRTIIVTTPNSEYNVRFATLPAGKMRHRDHRFEWTREQFQDWATAVARRFGYAVRFLPVGNEDPEVGPPTQMGVFTQQ